MPSGQLPSVRSWCVENSNCYEICHLEGKGVGFESSLPNLILSVDVFLDLKWLLIFPELLDTSTTSAFEGIGWLYFPSFLLSVGCHISGMGKSKPMAIITVLVVLLGKRQERI